MIGRALVFVAAALVAGLAMRAVSRAPDDPQLRASDEIERAAGLRHPHLVPPNSVGIVVAPGTRRAAQAVAEVVSTPWERHRGLGGRRSLRRDQGMLFVYPSAEPRMFWMKDCHIALDIAFIGPDRKILNVATLAPGHGLADSAIPRAHSAGAAPYVLEMNAGWFEAHRIGAGDEVRLPSSMDGLATR